MTGPITSDIIQLTPSTTFCPNKLNTAIVYGPGLIILNFLVCMMTEILLIGCFLSHTIQFNVLCVFVLTFLLSMCYFDDFSPTFSYCILMRSVIILIKLLCMYVCSVMCVLLRRWSDVRTCFSITATKTLSSEVLSTWRQLTWSAAKNHRP